MRFPNSGFWWLHLMGVVAVFCLGWFNGQNRAERKFLEMQRERDSSKKPAEPGS
jgi:hypothetical protein